MAVYREGYVFIEEVNRNSMQIFEDAVDFGMPVKRGDRMWNQLKYVVDTYGNPKFRSVIETGGVHTIIELVDEWAVSDGRKTRSEANDVFRVTYIKLKPQWPLTMASRGADGFITITKL